MRYRVCIFMVLAGLINSSIHFAWSQFGKTEITKWQDGKKAAVSLTFDDGSINQFRVAVPIMKSLGLSATFFIITGEIPGSKYHGRFLGRSTEEIIRETASVPTNKDNFFERASAVGYLGFDGTIEYHSRAGGLYEEGKVNEAYQVIDAVYSKVRQGAFKPKAEETAGVNRPNVPTWDELSLLAKQGCEISSHTVTHPRLAILDEANLIYELEKSRQEILDHLGPKHCFTIECPYGTEDERVVKYALARYPASRNRMPEPFLEEINRGSHIDPGESTKEYVQWQRGPLTKTSMKLMKSWVDTIAVHDNMWLVLVFHGVDGVGWQPKTGVELKEYFSYIMLKENLLWVATFQDATKYLRERKHCQVRTNWKGGVIHVSLRHDLDAVIYDLPLTLKSFVPPDWSVVEVRQGNRTTSVQVVRDGDKRYALYQAMPNVEPVMLVRADK